MTSVARMLPLAVAAKVFLPIDADTPSWVLPTIAVGFALICGAVGFFVFSFFVRHGKLATQIFRTLGFDDPSRVNLARIDRIARKSALEKVPLVDSRDELWTYRY